MTVIVRQKGARMFLLDTKTQHSVNSDAVSLYLLANQLMPCVQIARGKTRLSGNK